MNKWIGFTLSLAFASASHSALIITMHDVNNAQAMVGTVKAEDTQFGLLLTPQLHGLPTGIHGFHLHSNPSCDQQGMAAGGHFDPQNTQSHQGPYGQGHLGDLPALTVDENSRATLPILAPRLKVSDLKGHALMIHQGGDNYSDQPPLGGGGKRIVCGVIS